MGQRSKCKTWTAQVLEENVGKLLYNQGMGKKSFLISSQNEPAIK